MEAVMTSLKRHGSTLLWGCILAFLVATRAQMEAVRETLHYRRRGRDDRFHTHPAIRPPAPSSDDPRRLYAPFHLELEP